jgi:lactate dehydrogenase-like 2-hydroxyacid dehydrogenase
MEKPEVLMLGAMPRVEQAIDPLFTVHKPWQHKNPDGLMQEVSQRVRGVVTWSTTGVAINADFLARFPRVEIVSNIGVGYESIDVPAMRAKKVVVTYTPGSNSVDVAEQALGMVLAVGRDMLAGDAHVRAGKWPKSRAPTVHRVSGQTLGILGLGHIGLEVARLAMAFGMTVKYHNRKRRDDVPYEYVPTLIELAKASDYLVVAAPGGPETNKLVSREVLQALGPEGTLVNVGRGTLIDEDALLDLLESGGIRAAALDVFAQEPHMSERFFALPNVLLQPHRGGDTFEALIAQAKLVADNLRLHFDGQPALTPVK